MNRIRSELAQRIPREYWARWNISREEISDLLFFRSDATLKEIASYLSIDISDERGSDFNRDAILVFAIDLDTRDVVQRFRSITSAQKTLLISKGGAYGYDINSIIDKQLAFSLDGRYVILSNTSYRRRD